MPKQFCQTVYSFDELSQAAKDKAREWARENLLDYDWYENVFEDAKAIGKLMGIEIDKIYFSGFYSQGDGACFEGSYAYAKGMVKAIKEYAPLDTRLHEIAEGLAVAQKRNFYQIAAKVKHSGHYYHSRMTDIEVWKTDSQGYENSVDTEEEEIVSQLLRDYMNWIYRNLEKEYEYLTSDEQIDETINANEYTFLESGKREG